VSDEIEKTLKEIAVLLRRQVEQQDASVRRGEEMREKFGQRLTGFSGMREDMRQRREEFEKRREDINSNMEKSREQAAEHRREEREFRQRLLAELERHNQLLEALVKHLDSPGL
jgi:methyl-accepting chemotaxis protein